jgi:CHASE3 domain sensor protein
MVSQLSTTLDYDCKYERYNDYIKDLEKDLFNLRAEEIRTQREDDINKSISYHTEQLNEEIERCNKANDWVDSLLKSLN